MPGAAKPLSACFYKKQADTIGASPGRDCVVCTDGDGTTNNSVIVVLPLEIHDN